MPDIPQGSAERIDLAARTIVDAVLQSHADTTVHEFVIRDLPMDALVQPVQERLGAGYVVFLGGSGLSVRRLR